MRAHHRLHHERQAAVVFLAIPFALARAPALIVHHVAPLLGPCVTMDQLNDALQE